MPDITMCIGRSCAKRKNCYRHMAKPDILQSFSDFSELAEENCEYFWEVGSERQCESSKSLSE